MIIADEVCKLSLPASRLLFSFPSPYIYYYTVFFHRMFSKHENVFKVGMTRRLNPQDRVNELGDASVPFRFDVHSFIFSDDAVDLEHKLHELLSEKRVNKVNLRKEFFYTNIDELEQMVHDIEPTAEFNRTMLAEEFRQSLSSDGLYTSDAEFEDFDDE